MRTVALAAGPLLAIMALLAGCGTAADSAAPGAATLYVVVNGNNGGPPEVVPINTATDRTGRGIRVGKLPIAIALAPDGRTAYVANSGSDTVTPISTVTNHAWPAIKVGPSPSSFAFTRTGTTVYVSCLGVVTPVLTTARTVGQPIQVGSQYTGSFTSIAMAPAADMAYVIGDYATAVIPIELPSDIPGPVIRVGADPQFVDVTPDGRTAYVASYASSTITPIDTATGTAGPLRSRSAQAR